MTSAAVRHKEEEEAAAAGAAAATALPVTCGKASQALLPLTRPAPTSSAGQPLRSHHMISSVQVNGGRAARAPPDTKNDKREEQHRSHVAPLASLDGSITEPISDTQRTSTTETPTLSGYFDCDQLSDMVDDSLFEITNVGCLSRSVFDTPRQRGETVDTGKSDNIKNTGHHLKGHHQTGTPASSARSSQEKYEKKVHDEERKLRHKSAASFTSSQVPDQRDGPGSATPTRQAGGGPAAASGQDSSRAGQLAALVHCRPYDYSSSSTIPRWTAQGGGGSSLAAHLVEPPLASGNMAAGKQRSKSAHRFQAQQQQQQATSQLRPLAAHHSNEMGPRQVASGGGGGGGRSRSHRKARSNPDVREHPIGGGAPTSSRVGGPPEPMDSHCGSVCALCRSERAQGKKKEKKRFTFSLFNLFTTGTTANSSSNLGHEQSLEPDSPCVHCQATTASGKAKRNGTVSAATATPPPPPATSTSTSERPKRRRMKPHSGTLLGSHIKSRDSIRLTNQRKQRAVRSSNSYGDFQANAPGKSYTELLLDFSSSSGSLLGSRGQVEPGGRELRGSQSSYSIQRNSSGPSIAESPSKGPVSQRQTKSVKFTTPDRVMILPSGRVANHQGSSTLTQVTQYTGTSTGAGAGTSGGNANVSRTPSASLSTASANMLSAHTIQLMPPPIIKHRPVICQVPKSSSYSQTEPNKSLYEMLARYEGNRELIEEINEKLRLTETVASPKSALDQASSDEQLTPTSSLDREQLLSSALPATKPEREQYKPAYQVDDRYGSQMDEHQLDLGERSVEMPRDGDTLKVRQVLTTVPQRAGPSEQVDGTLRPTTSACCESNIVLQQTNVPKRSLANDDGHGHENNDDEEAGFSKDWLHGQQQRAFV